MSADNVAARFARRPDFELISYVEVGLPFWRLRTRCELLARAQVSPIDVFILRAVAIGVDQRDDLSILLGLDEVILDGAVGAMLVADWVEEADTDRLALTEKGMQIVTETVQERAEERMIAFEFDGLLRRPVLLDRPLEPNQLVSAGIREIPPHPISRPDELELAEHRSEVQQLIRRFSSRRDRQVDVLAIKEIVRRERVFQEATALLFRALEGNELRVAFVVDEELSHAHEQRFAQARLLDRIGLARGVRSRTRHSSLLSEMASELYDPDAESAARDEVQHRLAAIGHAGSEDEATAEALRVARRRLRHLPVRTLECYEHPQLLDVALRSAKTSLTVTSPRITNAVLDEDLAREIRRALRRGVHVKLGYGVNRDPAIGIDAAAFERLKRLHRDYHKLEVTHLGVVKSSVMVRDRALAAVTNFPLLGHRGDATRALGDDRGWLLAAREVVVKEHDQCEEALQRGRPRDLGESKEHPGTARGRVRKEATQRNAKKGKSPRGGRRRPGT